MSKISLRHLTKRYGKIAVVRDVSLEISEGEFVSLLGPSGCGKTTILRMVAGLVEPSDGTITVGGHDITHLPPNKRNVGLVFQSYALFPHMTVFENVAFGLRRKGEGGTVLKGRVQEALALVRLEDFGDRHPSQLSGGQQQRVAMARAIAPRPNVLLFDEPLSNLDAKLRDEMQIELKRLQRDLHITTLFVTHDQTEALSLSDRVCVVSDGVIQQFDTPEEIYHRPATTFVASFIGKPNCLAGTIRAGAVNLGAGLVLQSSVATSLEEGTPVDVFIRQEAVTLSASPCGRGIGLPGIIVLRSFSGARAQYVVRLSNHVEVVVEVASSAEGASFAQGKEVFLTIRPQDMIVLRSGTVA